MGERRWAEVWTDEVREAEVAFQAAPRASPASSSSVCGSIQHWPIVPGEGKKLSVSAAAELFGLRPENVMARSVRAAPGH